MKKQFKLLDVVHSGRKGIRGDAIDNPKYKGLVGYYCSFDVDDIQQFKPFEFTVIDSVYYDWWKTSEVLEVIKMDRYLLIETANSIYRFKES